MKASETYEWRAPSAIMAGVKHAKWSIFSAFLKPVQSDNLRRSSQVKKGRVVKIKFVPSTEKAALQTKWYATNACTTFATPADPALQLAHNGSFPNRNTPEVKAHR